MKTATLCFLLKKDAQNKITEICLAMKKRGFGEGKWNGVGGKVEEGETIEEAAIRETEEEIGVKLIHIEKRGVINFADYGAPQITLQGHVYISYEWEGKPTETEEMAPKWFAIKDIPYDDMWVDDELWLPEVLAGKSIKADFWFSEDGEVVLKYDLKVENTEVPTLRELL